MEEKVEFNEYATVSEDDGVNYREIAAMMSEIGYKMNHSSVRNYVLRIMHKFAQAMIEEWDLKVSNEKIISITKTPQFQETICEILQLIDADERCLN